MPTSVVFSMSLTRVMDVTESEPSLIASSIRCEWQSMIPGVTYLPVASITWHPQAAFNPLLILAILPSRIRMSVFSSVPLIAVITVAFLIKTSFSPEPKQTLAKFRTSPPLTQKQLPFSSLLPFAFLLLL
jgi:hypothetical protein